jgi:hypothetical protein
MKTLRELITATLRRARIVGSLEMVPAEDFELVASIYGTKLEEWRDRSLVYWENTGSDVAEIPPQVFDVLVDLMINQSESQFGKNTNLSVLDRATIEDQILRRLRRHTHMKSSGFPTQPEYF